MTSHLRARPRSSGWRSIVAGCLSCGVVACGGPTEPVTYCDVQPILESRCVRCHDDPPQHGAPFSLATYEATQETFVDAPMYEWMSSAVSMDFMPPVTLAVTPPVIDLTAAEEETIVQWAETGAAAGGCE